MATPAKRAELGGREVFVSGNDSGLFALHRFRIGDHHGRTNGGGAVNTHGVMGNSVIIQSVRDSARLTFSDAESESFTAALVSSHFSGQVIVFACHIVPPSFLFERMANEWRGWEKDKTWASLEDELALTATSDRLGHVELRVVMRNYADAADWRLEATLHLEAGQLEKLAHAVNGVFENLPAS